MADVILLGLVPDLGDVLELEAVLEHEGAAVGRAEQHEPRADQRQDDHGPCV